MIRATQVFPADTWSHAAIDTVILDYDHRHRRRLALKGEQGLDFLLDLPEATALHDGDGLLLEDGRVVAVKAAPEPLAEVRPQDTAHLVRLAWHLGNRHLPAQLAGDRLLIRRDHVIEEMLASLGATVAHVDQSFDPEGGAYAAQGGHGHPHHHDDHDHGQSDGHGHGHDHHHDHG